MLDFNTQKEVSLPQNFYCKFVVKKIFGFLYFDDICTSYKNVIYIHNKTNKFTTFSNKN